MEQRSTAAALTETGRPNCTVTLDRMDDEQRALMLGQTSPQLLRVLVELDRRAQRREKPAEQGPPSRLDQLRAAHASRHRPGAVR